MAEALGDIIKELQCDLVIFSMTPESAVNFRLIFAFSAKVLTLILTQVHFFSLTHQILIACEQRGCERA